MFRPRNLSLLQKFSKLSLSSNNVGVQNACYSTVGPSKNTTPDITIPPPPKRSSNVFALFIRDCFKKMPQDMPVKQRFALAGQEWRQLPAEQKEHYQKICTEEFVKYKTAMNKYLGSLNEQELAQYKQMKKDQMKTRNRQRIKSKLRELKYPKRSVSAYLFFLRDMLQKQFPDGNYPSPRTAEHADTIKEWSKKWHGLSQEQRQKYTEQAEQDKKRYFEELEQWKQELAKPENEEKFKQLERLSKKMEVANLTPEKAKIRAKRQRRLAAKIIRKRLLKKASSEVKKAKKAAQIEKKKTVSAKKKKSSTKSGNTKKSSASETK